MEERGKQSQLLGYECWEGATVTQPRIRKTRGKQTEMERKELFH